MKSYTFTVDTKMRHELARIITFECYTTQRILWMSLMTLYFAFIIWAMFLMIFGYDGFFIGILVGLVIGVAIAFGLSYLLTMNGIKRMIKMVGTDFTVSSSKSGLNWGNHKINSKYSYDSFKKMLEYDKYVLIFISAKLYIFLPLNPDNQGLMDEVRQGFERRAYINSKR